MTRTKSSRFIAMLLAVIMVFFAMPMTALTANAAAASGNTTEFAGGSGTAEDPYLISTVDHLYNIRNHLDAHFKMMNNLDLSEATAKGGKYDQWGYGWKPIGCNDGYEASEFTGTLDGNGKTITGLRIELNDDIENHIGEVTGKSVNLGLFANVSGIIYNLSIIDSSITVGASPFSTAFLSGRVGSVAGSCSGTLRNIHTDNNIKGQFSIYSGGLVGYLSSCGIIEYCTNDGQIAVGMNTDTYNGYAGGLVGFNAGSISYSYNTGKIVGGYWNEYPRIGGIAGIQNHGSISDCYNAGELAVLKVTLYGDFTETTNIGSYVSGIANSSYSKCLRCYSTTSPIAYQTSGNSITQCYNRDLDKQETFVGWDFVDTWSMGGDANYPYPELQCFALSGSITIDGRIAYNETVKPDLSGLKKQPAKLTYAWYLNGTLVSRNATYTIKSTDISKKLTLTISSIEKYCSGSVTSPVYVVSKGTQPAKPTVPELQYLDDSKFEISTVSTQEYSIDNINWQRSGMFENLDPNKTYTVYSRILENDLYLLGESIEVLSVGTDRRPLSGKVSIIGTARYGDTLTADVSELLPTGATYTYEWKSGSKVVGTESTYTITQADIGNSIVLYVKGTDDYVGTISSAAVVATKTSVQLPNAPVVVDKTNTTVTLQEKTGYEYSMDKIKWQNSSVFTGLSAATEYTFYQRVKETDTTFASKVSNGTKETTLKNTVAAPAKPVIEKITNSSVTLKVMDGYEYSLDGLTWQTSNVFTGLKPYTEYSFCQRIAENKTDYASAQSGYTIVITLKNLVAAPGAPVVEKATATSVTLVDISGYEYSMDGTTWQSNNVFTGLTTLETYTFYQRIKETNTDYTSATSTGTSFKVKNVVAAPAAPTLTEKTNNKIVVEVKVGYKYSINKTTWNTTGVFTGLQPNQTYTVYCRIPETDAHYASAISNALTVTTLKNTVSAPSAPVLSNKTSTSVTLVSNSTYEYSKDGKTWQTSNVFSGLSPNTEYTFYQRKAETNTSYASEKSAGLTVTTPKTTVSAPSAPVLSTKTATSVTLVKKSGYEYSKDGSIWQSSNVFEGLQANTLYSFYQRIVENDTTYASAASAALTVTTPKKDAPAVNSVNAVRVTATSVTLAPYTGYEYSMNGTTWQTSNVFTGLTANTTYTFYQRIAETADTNASASSAACNVTTSVKSACSISLAAPIVAETTTSKVVLVAREGYEYSKNGTTWQTSNTFSGLSSNTNYTFYQRIAETSRELASAKSVGVTVSTYKLATGTTSAMNYQKLYSYVQKNGRTSSGGIRFLPITMSVNGTEYKLELSLKENGIQFYITYYDNETVYITTSFILQETSKNLIVKHYVGGTVSISTYPYYAIESAENNLTIDRSTYTSEKTYNLINRGEYLTASQLTDLFNSQLTLSTMLYDKYLYDNLGFGLMGLGFTSFVGFGSTACDIPSSYHSDASETRNAYAATCTTDGYTGDNYCVNCGEKKSSGSVITCRGSHTYSDSCDKSCNTCGEERVIEHQYSNICDTTCNICNATRAEIEHIFDNECDETCNGCSETRKAPHIYDNSDDLICNGCGQERPPYAPGDVTGDDKINSLDGLMLLRYLNGWNVSIASPEAMDVNSDGKVNSLDGLILMRYLNGWNVTLG